VPPPGTTDGANTGGPGQPQTVHQHPEHHRRQPQRHPGVARGQQQLADRHGRAIDPQRAVSAGDDHEHYYRLDYNQFLNSEGTQLSLFASRYRADPGTNVLTSDGFELKPHKEDDRYSIGVSHPFIAASNELLNAGARLYAVDKTATTWSAIRSASKSAPTCVPSRSKATGARAMPANCGFSVVACIRAGQHGRTFQQPGMDLNFLRLRLSGVQSDKFFDNWQGVLSAALYWSDDTLPDSERAVFGGQNFGRGYPDDQASGDGLGRPTRSTTASTATATGCASCSRTWCWTVRKPGSTSCGTEQRPVIGGSGAAFWRCQVLQHCIEAAKPMSDEALDTFNRRARYSISFSYQL
jgi:hypothetical protein